MNVVGEIRQARIDADFERRLPLGQHWRLTEHNADRLFDEPVIYPAIGFPARRFDEFFDTTVNPEVHGKLPFEKDLAHLAANPSVAARDAAAGRYAHRES
jgi:hypothetical protein